jgi:hypothetical protein
MPYVKKFAKKAKKFAKKRYTQKSGKIKVGQVYRDLQMVKRQLNVEHKHIDFKFGSGQAVSAQFPTKQTPIILPIPLPARGTSYNQRVGNQVRVVHLTSKLEFIFNNNTDLIQRTNVRVQIVFAKDASNVPLIANLYDTDANGHYTPMSMVNTQEYKKYVWLKSHDHKKGYTQPTNRYPPSNVAGDSRIEGGTSLIPVEDTTATLLNKAIFYSNKQSKTSIRMMFENGSDTNLEQMKPYLLLRSDVIDADTDYDPIAVTGIVRMTYVDN